MLNTESAERNPFNSLILLLLLVFAGAIVFTIVSFGLGALFYGSESVLKLASDSTSNIELLKIVQIVTSIGMFIIPALVYAKIQSNDWLGYLKIVPVSFYLILLTVLISLVASPALDYSMQLNKITFWKETFILFSAYIAAIL